MLFLAGGAVACKAGLRRCCIEQEVFVSISVWQELGELSVFICLFVGI